MEQGKRAVVQHYERKQNNARQKAKQRTTPRPLNVRLWWHIAFV
jgi:hypothetical protein